MHWHGIYIPLKKREIIRRCRFTYITACYWLIVTITNRLLAYSNKQERTYRLSLADVGTNPQRTSAGRLIINEMQAIM